MQTVSPTQRWPRTLFIVRHGQSSGNVARDKAHEAGVTHIDLDLRDADVPLSDLGREQSEALGAWFADLPEDERPDAVLVSPYLRARQTAEAVHAGGGVIPGPGSFAVDERLREKEFGILDRLTTAGIRSLHPEQAEMRRLIGKFYHRPPGGESWCDVILRLRSLVDTLSLHYAGKRVLIVSHQVVVLCMRYLLETMTEDEILAIDKAGDVANCGLTEYAWNDEAAPGMTLVRYNMTAPLRAAGAAVTREPDAKVAAR